VPDFKVTPHQHQQTADKPSQIGRIADVSKSAEQRESSLAPARAPGAFSSQSTSAAEVKAAAGRSSVFADLRWRRDAGGELDRISEGATPRAVSAVQSRAGVDGPQTSSKGVTARDGSHRSAAQSEPVREATEAGSSVPNESQVRLLLEELTVLESRCTTLAERLSELVRDLQSGRLPGEPPGPELATLRRDVEALQNKTLDLAGLLSVPAEAATGPSMTLAALRGVLEQLVAALQRQAFRDMHARAALELKSVLRLEHQDGVEFAPLADCKTGALKLLAEIERAQWPDSHSECLALVERRHAYSQLVEFVRHGGELSDADWESAADAVATSFGKPLSIAAVRGRLQEDGGTARPAEAVRHCPACNADLDADARFCDECGVGVE
jgi:hypothetical protein